MLWVDKYRPTSFDRMDVHKPLSAQLKNIVKSGDFPHMLLYGPSGAGKKTRVMALLKQLFGTRAEKVKLENKDLKVGAAGTKTITVTLLSSASHIEVNPSDYGVYDRYVISNLIKEIASSAPIEYQSSSSAASSSSLSDAPQQQPKNFKVVVLNEVDNLTREAQQALRRTMEKYMKTCRIILCASGMSKVLGPVRSRCLCVRVPAPSKQDVVSVLKSVALQENLQLPDAFAQRIAEAADGNMRKALLALEASKVDQYPFKADQAIKLADWERFIQDIAKDMMEEQSPQKLYQLREKYYALITNCIPPELILKKVAQQLLSYNNSDPQLQFQIVHWASFYEHRLKSGSRVIFHLEAFTAKFMSMYKKFLVDAYGE